MVGYPVTDEFQHQFLGLVTRDLPNGDRNPAYDDVQVDGTRDGRVKQREAFIRRAYQGCRRDDAPRPTAPARRRPDDVRLVRPRVRAAVPRHRREQGPGRPRPAVAAADVELPPCHRRDDRQGQGVLGRRHRPDLPQPRRPRPGRRWAPAGAGQPRGGGGGADRGRIPRPHRSQRLDPRRQPGGLEGHRPRLHQGRGPRHPQRAGQHDRHGPPDPHRRPRRVLVAAVPVRCRHAGHPHRPVGVLRPARLRARRPGPRQQHQHAGDVPGRRRCHRPGNGRRRAQHRPRPDRGVPPGHPGPAAQPGCGAPRPARRRQQVPSAVDHRAERLPRPARPDLVADRRSQRLRRRRGPAGDDVRRGGRVPAGRDPVAGGR